MTDATIEKFPSRLGNDAWAVTWGPGLTQTIICSSEEEAAEVARTRRPVARFVELLVTFDGRGF